MIVIEASAMVDALVDRPPEHELLATMADAQRHAPVLIDDEVVGALRGHALAGRLTDQRLDDAITDLTDLRIERYPLSTMMRAVAALRENLAVYDAAYVVLAQALEIPLVTADTKLLEARRLGVDVRVIRTTEP
ncbi:MAG: type II toxin-antitoxin system VapC family toxin [Phycicoccus sp.]